MKFKLGIDGPEKTTLKQKFQKFHDFLYLILYLFIYLFFVYGKLLLV